MGRSSRAFAEAGFLSSIRPQYLIRFLRPYQSQLAEKGLALPGDDQVPDIDRLSMCIFQHAADLPPDLTDGLFHAAELAHDDGTDELARVAGEREAELPDDPEATGPERALHLWHTAREVVSDTVVGLRYESRRAFDRFVARAGRTIKDGCFLPEGLSTLEATLKVEFVKHDRGGATRVLHGERSDVHWFFIRHGAPFRHEEVIKSDGVVAHHIRPAVYDVVYLDAQKGRLQVNAGARLEAVVYREVFGEVLFGRRDHFPEGTCYTLQPLRDDVDAALECEDIPGMEWVRLVEYRLRWPGPLGEVETRRASDVVAALRARGRELPTKGTLIGAAFEVKFADSPRPRSVRIVPPNKAVFNRRGDSALIDEWLDLRGFVVGRKGLVHAGP